jgi:hypothetical protein
MNTRRRGGLALMLFMIAFSLQFEGAPPPPISLLILFGSVVGAAALIGRDKYDA